MADEVQADIVEQPVDATPEKEESIDDFIASQINGTGEDTKEDETKAVTDDEPVDEDKDTEDKSEDTPEDEDEDEGDVTDEASKDAKKDDKDEDDAEPDESQTITPPPSMSAKDRESFYKLPPDSQQWLVDRAKSQEKDYTQKTMEIAESRKTFDKLEQVIAPRREALALQGMDESTAVSQLFALSDFANNDPVAFVKYLFEQRGIPLSSLTSEQGDAQANDNPQISRLTQEVSSLREMTNQQLQIQDQQEQTEISHVMESFSTDGKHPFFEELRPAMGALVNGIVQLYPGLSTTDYLERAYAMSLSDNSEIMSRVNADNSAKENAKRVSKAKADAAKAKKASSTNVKASGALPQGAEEATDVDSFLREVMNDRKTA